MSAFTSEQPSRARLFDERRNDGVSIAARNVAASDAQSVTTSGVRDHKQTEDYKTCVRRTGIERVEIDRKYTEDYETCVRRTGITWVEIYIVYLFRQFYVFPSPERTAFAHVFHRGTPGVRSLQAEKISAQSKNSRQRYWFIKKKLT